MERDVLTSISDLLGACTQNYLVRKAQPQKQLLANTHLVVITNSGSKYEAARKWGLPTVSKQWLIDCAKQSRRLPEVDYDIDAEVSLAANRKSQNDEAMATKGGGNGGASTPQSNLSGTSSSASKKDGEKSSTLTRNLPEDVDTNNTSSAKPPNLRVRV